MRTPTSLPPARSAAKEQSWLAQHRGLVIGVAVGLALLLAGAVWAVVTMLNNPAQTQTIRDIFIVFMALESLLIGGALIVLIVQLALLTNVLQNEVRPILNSTNETIRTVKGTTAFLSDNLVGPVIKVQSSVAALRRTLDFFRPLRRS